MPYINQLQDDNAKLRAEIRRLREGLNSIKIYCSLDKFSNESPDMRNVNPDDIILRVNEVMYASERMY